MTDSTRYKSIIVRVDTHKKLKELAGRDRKISGVVSQLVEKEWNKKKERPLSTLVMKILITYGLLQRTEIGLRS